MTIGRMHIGNCSFQIGASGSSSSEPILTPNPGKVLYRTNANGEWIEAPAVIYQEEFLGVDPDNNSQPSYEWDACGYQNYDACFQFDSCGDTWDGIRESVYEIILPSKDVYGRSVTSIGNGALGDCTSLTNVMIPDSVLNIGYMAFYQCSNLTSITIPNSVISISDMAFYECSQLVEMTFQGKTTAQVNMMSNLAYWGLETSFPITIHCTDDDIIINNNSSCSDSCCDNCCDDYCDDCCDYCYADYCDDYCDDDYCDDCC